MQEEEEEEGNEEVDEIQGAIWDIRALLLHMVELGMGFAFFKTNHKS